MLSFIKKLLGRNLFFKRKYIVVILAQAWPSSYLRFIKNIKHKRCIVCPLNMLKCLLDVNSSYNIDYELSSAYSLYEFHN